MLLEELGVLSTAQDLTDGATDSENSIQLPQDSSGDGIPNLGYGEIWLSIITETKIGGSAGTSSTYTFDLVVATEKELTTTRSVCRIVIVNTAADPRIAAAEGIIAAMEVGMQIDAAMDSDYAFLGLISTLADGNGTATISINAALSPSKPRTKDNVQVVRSNVGVPS